MTETSLKKRVFDRLLNGLMQTGMFDALNRMMPDNLTVLNYHRVNEPDDPNFEGFKANISATPDMFDRQVGYLKQRFNFVTVADISAWVRDRRPLPPHAAILTFDDGYADNLKYAFPVLVRHGISALIFLTTDFINTIKPAYWDVVAYCFQHTTLIAADLPLLGRQHWTNDREKEQVMMTWIEALKRLLESEKEDFAGTLPEILKVPVPGTSFSTQFLTWEQIRGMAEHGIEFGSHTVSHPILTKIPLEQAAFEITESKRLIEKEIGRPVDCFAYPNGGVDDINDGIIRLVQEAGYSLAFTLIPGRNRYEGIRKTPYTIRRIFLGHHDSFPRFAAKTHGMRRFF
jgi:peptidoglycan/xylan/chitin deacetylase (PgdA/CDA1 family)